MIVVLCNVISISVLLHVLLIFAVIQFCTVCLYTWLYCSCCDFLLCKMQCCTVVCIALFAVVCIVYSVLCCIIVCCAVILYDAQCYAIVCCAFMCWAHVLCYIYTYFLYIYCVVILYTRVVLSLVCHDYAIIF